VIVTRSWVLNALSINSFSLAFASVNGNVVMGRPYTVSDLDSGLNSTE
jgi:hypothetical protein